MTITAVFGIDDFTTADVACAEAGDGCDIELGGINVNMLLLEVGDSCLIAGAAPIVTSIDIAETGDSCVITGQIGTVIVLPSTTDRFAVTVPDEQFLVRVPKQEELVETV